MPKGVGKKKYAPRYMSSRSRPTSSLSSDSQEHQPQNISQTAHAEQDRQDSLHQLLNTRVQITLLCDPAPSIWGQLVDISGNGGEEVLTLHDAQIDNDGQDEFILTADTIKKMESLATRDSFYPDQRDPIPDQDQGTEQPIKALEHSPLRTRQKSQSRPTTPANVSMPSPTRMRSRSRSPCRTRSRSKSESRAQSNERALSTHSTSLNSEKQSLAKRRASESRSETEGTPSSPNKVSKLTNIEFGNYIQKKLLEHFETWKSWAQAKLEIEMEESMACNKSPDIYSALIKAFDAAEIMIDEDEIRSIQIDPKDHPLDFDTMFKFYKEASGQDTTILHEFFGQWQDRKEQARYGPKSTSPENMDEIYKNYRKFYSHNYSPRFPETSPTHMSPIRPLKVPSDMPEPAKRGTQRARHARQSESENSSDEQNTVRKIFSSTVDMFRNRSNEPVFFDQAAENARLDAKRLIARAPDYLKTDLYRLYKAWEDSPQTSFYAHVRFMEPGLLEDRIPKLRVHVPESNPEGDEDGESDSNPNFESGLMDEPDPSWTDEQWHSLFVRCMLPVTYKSADLAMRSQHKKALNLDKETPVSNSYQGTDMSAMYDEDFHISEQDFLPDGKYAHVFIPNYVYIPAEILKDWSPMALPPTSTEYYALWYKLYKKRRDAADHLEWNPTPVRAPTSPWVKLLQNRDVVKPLYFENLDEHQYTAAYNKLPMSETLRLSKQVVYDRLYRPLERMVALSMKLNGYLVRALNDWPAATDFVHILTRLTGLPCRPSHLSVPYIVSQMAQIRLWTMDEFTPLKPYQVPPMRLSLALGMTTPTPTADASMASASSGLSPTEQANLRKIDKDYDAAKLQLQENLLNISAVQKEIKAVQAELQANKTSRDVQAWRKSISKLKDRIDGINSSNIALWKKIQILAQKSVNCQPQNKSVQDIIEAIKDDPVEDLLFQLDDWHDHRRDLRNRFNTISRNLEQTTVTKQTVMTLHEAQTRLDLIQQKLDLDKEIQHMSGLITGLIPICQAKASNLSSPEKSHLSRSQELNELEIRMHGSVHPKQQFPPKPNIRFSKTWASQNAHSQKENKNSPLHKVCLVSFAKTSCKDSNPDPAAARSPHLMEGHVTIVSSPELKVRLQGQAKCHALTSPRNSQTRDRLPLESQVRHDSHARVKAPAESTKLISATSATTSAPQKTQDV